MMKEFGMLITQARLDEPLTLSELAEKAGVELNALQRMENGSLRTTLDDVIKVATALNRNIKIEIVEKSEALSSER
ncbi:hypothetical protein BVX99_00860 [bacterium F16]|nr:hypothetical protein BVX99_00860 [bacterium F16]